MRIARLGNLITVVIANEEESMRLISIEHKKLSVGMIVVMTIIAQTIEYIFPEREMPPVYIIMLSLMMVIILDSIFLYILLSRLFKIKASYLSILTISVIGSLPVFGRVTALPSFYKSYLSITLLVPYFNNIKGIDIFVVLEILLLSFLIAIYYNMSMKKIVPLISCYKLFWIILSAICIKLFPYTAG